MKIKIIYNNSDYSLEEEIQTFIENKDIIDIKYNPQTLDSYDAVLIMYNEKKGETNEN